MRRINLFRKILLITGYLIGTTLIFSLPLIFTHKSEIKVNIEYKDQGNSEDIPIVEEIDGGGLFSDKLEENGTLTNDLGNIEEVDTSTPDAFKKSVIGRCLYASNYYGAQCVSLARDFWWSYAGFDVSTCGTGLAKGMMNCSEQNAKDQFEVIWKPEDIQAGTWIVLDGSMTGHICMAMGPVNNGYVNCLGENQGGIPCDGGGSAANIINLSIKNFIGGYTPIKYIKKDPVPESPDTGKIN